MKVKEIIELRLKGDYNNQEAINGIFDNYEMGMLTYDETKYLLSKITETVITSEVVDGETVSVERIQTVDVTDKLRMVEIRLRLKELDIKTFKFIDGELTETEYEPFRLEKLALRTEYNALESEKVTN